MTKKYLSVLCALLVGVSIFSAPVKAEDDSEAGEEAAQLNEQIYEELVYEIVDGEVKIISCDKSVEYMNIPETINGYPVTMIGDSAFEKCTAMEGTIIPGSEKSIGKYAYNGCTALEEVIFPAAGLISIGDYAFRNCTGITSVNIPTSVTDIGSSAFSGCSSLKDISIPSGVTVIRNGTFSGCTSLMDMTLPEGLTAIEDYAFTRTGITAIVVPDNVTSIGNMAFASCGALTKISVPEKASFTGPAFQNCMSLKTAGPAGGGYDYEFGWKTNIPNYAFSQCAGLTSVTLPDSITRIGKEAFYACAALPSLHIPDKVSYLGERAFAYSENLETVSGMDAVSGVGSDAFLGTKVKVLSFGKGVEVNMYAYSDYPYLEEFKFIRGDAIGSLAFENCTALKKVWINHSVKEIADGAFSGCTSLQTVYFHGTKAEWDKITVGENNEPLKNAEIVYLAPVTAVKLNASSITLEPGKTFDLKVVTTPSGAYMGDVQTEWKVSSGSDVIKIDQNGKITAVKNGSAQVTATVTDRMDDKKFTVKCSVTVGAEDSVTAFVKRLYKLCFNREADAGGLNGWVTKLKNGTSTAANVVQAFFTSKEMQNLKLSNGDFVERCYLVMMGRASDAGGKKGWVEKLDAGMSVNYVLRGFVASREFANICREYGIVQGTITCPENRDQNQGITAFVSRCYSEVLGRKADTGGLNNWCGKILNAADKKQEAINTASNGFFHSPEYLNKNTSNDQYVRTLYRTFLGREADTGGYNNWMAKLNSGTSRDSVMNGFAYSAEFANIMAKYGIR